LGGNTDIIRAAVVALGAIYWQKILNHFNLVKTEIVKYEKIEVKMIRSHFKT
jgi:hypothetical protein